MNMKTNTHRRGLHRIVAFLLCAVCVFSLLPAQAFAAGVGQKASSWLGDQYVGSDGQHYYSPVPTNFLAYNSDGTTDKRSGSGGSAYRHYMLTDSDGVTHSVYCVESGIPYNTSENTYTSENGTNSDYLNMLPSAARRGITLTAIYGWKPGASLPVSGINEDDYKMATQIILWEYQQQLRSDPYSRHSNGHASADQYYSVVAGRPAEKAYNWILEQVASHSTVPSFTAANKGDAPVLELKWDTSRKVYTLTVTDTNNLNIDLQMLSGSGVTVSRNGNQYTFTSKNMIMEPVSFEFRKDIPVANDMLIWGRPGYQTMMTGASDPVSFFMNIKTETYGTAKIVKTSEDIIGWLTLPDTVINYPVTQADDNEYYLHHLYDGTYNKVGCLFADYENKADFSDRNTIIYGHNMRDGSMFAALNEYDEQSYFDTHKQMYLVTPEGGYLCEVFAAFVAKPSESGSDTSPWRLSWKDDGAYTTWLTAMAERSVVETDVTVTSSDKVLTLSTCTPGGASRFIVMAKLVEVNNEAD